MQKNKKLRKKPFIGWLVLAVAMIVPSFLSPTHAINVKASAKKDSIQAVKQENVFLLQYSVEYDPCGLVVVEGVGCPSDTDKIQINDTDKNIDIIKQISAEYSIDWKIIYAICMVESNCKADTIGDSGQSYGAFQIHLPSHPNVSKEQAMDMEFATKWTIEHGYKYKDNPSLFAKSHNGMGKKNQWYVDRFNQVFKNL